MFKNSNMNERTKTALVKASEDLLELFKKDSEGGFLLRWWDEPTIMKKVNRLKRIINTIKKTAT